MPKQEDSLGVKMPSIDSEPSGFFSGASRFSLAWYAASVVAPANWLSLTISIPGYFLIALRKPSSRLVVLAEPGA